MKAPTALSAYLLAMWLSACASGQSTTYEIPPAPTPEGAACINTCVNARSTCHARCDADARFCRMANPFTGRPVLNRPQFDDNECNASLCARRCEISFRICHTNCVGKGVPSLCVGANGPACTHTP